MNALIQQDAVTLAGLISEKEISPVELVDAVLRQLEALNLELNCFITACPEQALDAAKAAEAAVLRGGTLPPLHGIPFSVKDLLPTAGVRTTYGSYAHKDAIPDADCVAVARLKAAGAILIGKTTTPEFGHKPLTEAPLFGKTRNPWNLDRTSGGSSGGAAAAVAAGIGPLAVGTDGGGSIRIPAAACGIVGMKQSLGVVPHDQTGDVFGLMAYIGPMTRTVPDAAAMLAVMAGPDAADPHSLHRAVPGFQAAARAEGDLKGLRIRVCQYLGNAVLDTEVATAFQQALNQLQDLGAKLITDDHPFPNTLPVWGPLTFSLWAYRFSHLNEPLGDQMSASLRHWMAEGKNISALELQEAMAVRTRLYREIERDFADVDLWVTPTLARTAVSVDHDPLQDITINNETAGGLRDAWYPYTHPFNLTGHPAITVPMGLHTDGLPLGLQFVGPFWQDARVIRAAALFESVQPGPGLAPLASSGRV